MLAEFSIAVRSRSNLASRKLLKSRDIDESCTEEDQDFECPPSQKYNKKSGKCVDRCPGGSFNVKSEKCEGLEDCNKTQVRNASTGKCQCPLFATMNKKTGDCVCPLNSTMKRSAGACLCNGGFAPDYKARKCVRPPSCKCGFTFNGKAGKCVSNCSKESYTFWNESTSRCECPDKATMPKGSKTCKCHHGYRKESTGIGCTRICSAEENYNADTGKCSPKCKTPMEYNSGTKKCDCPAGQTYNKGVCKCFKGSKMDDKSGKCVPDCQDSQVYNDKTKKCDERCQKGQTWNAKYVRCDCPPHMIFHAKKNSCGCALHAKQTDKGCVPACTVNAEIYDAKTGKCTKVCDPATGQVFNAVTKECECSGPKLAYSDKTKKCEPTTKPPKKCHDKFEVYDNDQNKCVCDFAKRKMTWNNVALKCGCENPYMWNKTKDGCVFNPNCPTFRVWDKLKNTCVDRCDLPEKWNADLSRCEVPSCKSGSVYDKTLKKCKPRCDEASGKKWNADTKACVDTCNKASGLVWSTSSKTCEKKCKPPREVYDHKADTCNCADDKQWNSEKKACEAMCEASQGVSWCYGKKRCVSICDKGERWSGGKCVLIDSPGPKPPKPLKNDPSVNLNFSKHCSYRGYRFHGICFCPSTFKGPKCEEVAEPGYFATRSKCDDWTLRYDSLFSIYPGYYPNGEDPTFPRNQNSIGTGKAFRGPTGNSWIQLHSLVKKKFHIFNGKINILDIKQGSYGNCYMVASLGALVAVRDACLIREVLLTHQDNDSHIYITRWYKEGKVRIVAVDDWVPAYSGKPTGVPPNERDTFWAAILEKAWSKIHGSYRNTWAGIQTNVLTALTGAPNEYLFHNTVRDPMQIYNRVCNAIKAGMPVATCAMRGSQLDTGHAYAVVQCYQPKLDDGSTANLVLHFNPYNQGSKWKRNPWHDTSPRFTESVRKQVDFIDDAFDGLVYQDYRDFKRNFQFSMYSMSQKGYQANSFLQEFDSSLRRGRWGTYEIKFTVGAGQKGKPFWVWIEEADKRYRGQCNSLPWGVHSNNVVTPGGSSLRGVRARNFYGMENYLKVTVDDAEAGEYTIQTKVKRLLDGPNWFPVMIYGVAGEIKFNGQLRNLNLDNNLVKSCGGECPGLCNFYNGQCMN